MEIRSRTYYPPPLDSRDDPWCWHSLLHRVMCTSCSHSTLMHHMLKLVFIIQPALPETSHVHLHIFLPSFLYNPSIPMALCLSSEPFFFWHTKNWLAQHYTATVISTTVIRRKYLCLVNCVFLTMTILGQNLHLPFISQSKRHSQSVSPIGLGGMLSHNKLAEPCGASITHVSFPSVQSFPGEGTFSKIVLLPPE